MVGETLSHFQITARLGAGGMGEVYRATDTKLGREVAIKVLPETLDDDAGRLARFEREARVLASLNHPHIASIYSSESARLGSRTIHFLVIELVEGEDLAARIARGPLAVDDALGIASCIAEALEAAHARGIIHRDLKPANVMVTAAGGLKVLDFGLAKQLMPSVPDDSTSATRTFEQLTGQSQIVGTVPYMSPEQLRAGSVDHRSDMFSLGVMLFEMLAGRRPFQGGSRVDLMAAILKEPPADLSALRPDLDPRLIDLVLQCVAKDPTDRVASARDLLTELTTLRQSPVAPPRQRREARPPPPPAP
ncbi:MAG TPA: serine/threonine-protein kinase, partial [Vicinamibacterales bacterium]|nr:serine/threonine-protein kinase [Vicinamibacterales bacterium]